MAPLLDLCGRNGARGVALLSSERVRLLRCAEGALEELEDWELSITSLDWRERKSQSTNNPARAQGVSSSGHDQFGERLDHNRQRFLARVRRPRRQSGLEERGLGGSHRLRPRQGRESTSSPGSARAAAKLTLGGDGDLISLPKGRLD